MPHLLEGLLPPPFELVCDEAVGGVDGIVLTLHAIAFVTRSFELGAKGSEHFVVRMTFVLRGQAGGLDRRRLDHTQHLGRDPRIDVNAAEADAISRTILSRAALVAAYVAPASTVVDVQLVAAPRAAHEPRQYSPPLPSWPLLAPTDVVSVGYLRSSSGSARTSPT